MKSKMENISVETLLLNYNNDIDELLATFICELAKYDFTDIFIGRKTAKLIYILEKEIERRKA